MVRLTSAILCVCAGMAATAAAESDAPSAPVALPRLLPVVALPTVSAETGGSSEEIETAQPEAGKFSAGPDATFWQGWKHKVEAGINGSTGNSETFSIRGLVGAKRTSETMETTADVGYIYNTSEGKKSKSRGEGNLRNDWLFKDSNWGFFATAKLEYDEFQRWQWRASGFLGPSYTFIKDDKTVLRGRVGAGGNYEFGKDAKEEFVPELDLGLDFSHKLTERQNIFASIDYYPSLSEFPQYRALGKAGWEIVVDPEVNMYLKIGVSDRYISNPGTGFKKNDLEYFLTLGWEF